MPRKYDYAFSEQQLRDGHNRCIDNARGLLIGAKILNENVKTQQYALGLYMYAVEEYGKAILLKNAIKGNKKKYQIDAWILGWGNPVGGKAHNEKMMIGFDNLPNDCRIFSRGVKLTEPLPSTKTITIKKGKQGPYDQLSISKGLTGIFIDTTNTNPFDFYNLDLKTACFYMDWHKDNWKYDVAIGSDVLEEKINCLKDALANGI